MRLQCVGFPELRVPLPRHAQVDFDTCEAPRLRRGILSIRWRASQSEASRECCLRVVSCSPLIYECSDFLSPDECKMVIAAALMGGKKRLGSGEWEVARGDLHG